jgi:hypothetical protein
LVAVLGAGSSRPTQKERNSPKQSQQLTEKAPAALPGGVDGASRERNILFLLLFLQGLVERGGSTRGAHLSLHLSLAPLLLIFGFLAAKKRDLGLFKKLTAVVGDHTADVRVLFL